MLPLVIRTDELSPVSTSTTPPPLPEPSITVIVPVLSIFERSPLLSKSKPIKKLPAAICVKSREENETLGISTPDPYIYCELFFLFISHYGTNLTVQLSVESYHRAPLGRPALELGKFLIDSLLTNVAHAKSAHIPVPKIKVSSSEQVLFN